MAERGLPDRRRRSNRLVQPAGRTGLSRRGNGKGHENPAQMKRLLFALLATLPMGGQQEQPMRVTVNLVQVDATVTDSKGNPVPDLKPDDFRVLLDGKPQPLKSAEYVPLRELPSGERKAMAPAASGEDVSKPPMPAEPLK